MKQNQNEKYSVLIVDDVSQSRRILKNIISTAGYKVHECENGLEALNFVRKSKPDIILMDYNMPKLDGPDTIIQIRNMDGTENIKILMITANSDSDSVKKAVIAGIQGYILKPIKIYDVLSKISELLN